MSVDMKKMMDQVQFRKPETTPLRPSGVERSIYSLHLLMSHCNLQKIDQATSTYFKEIINSAQISRQDRVIVDIKHFANLINGEFPKISNRSLNIARVKGKMLLKKFKEINVSQKRSDPEEAVFKRPFQIYKKPKVTTLPSPKKVSSISLLLEETENSILTPEEYLKTLKTTTIEKALFKNLFNHRSSNLPAETLKRLQQVYDEKNEQPYIQVENSDFLALCNNQKDGNYTQLPQVEKTKKMIVKKVLNEAKNTEHTEHKRQTSNPIKPSSQTFGLEYSFPLD
jgi:hypothetical protein